MLNGLMNGMIFDKTNPDKVLKVTYNVKNLSDSDLAVGVDIDLFVGGNKMETYPNKYNGVNFTGSINGRCQRHFGIRG